MSHMTYSIKFHGKGKYLLIGTFLLILVFQNCSPFASLDRQGLISQSESPLISGSIQNYTYAPVSASGGTPFSGLPLNLKPSSMDGTLGVGTASSNQPGLTDLILWNLSDGPPIRPINGWDISSYTGFQPSNLSQSQRGFDNSWPGSTAVQAEGSTFGINIHSKSVEHRLLGRDKHKLIPIVVAYDLPSDSQVFPWKDNQSLSYSFDLQIPTAKKRGGSEVQAVAYLNLHYPDENGVMHAFWYGVSVFDLRGAKGHSVKLDDCSTCTGSPIVQSILGRDSVLSQPGPGSEGFQSRPWTGFRRFQAIITAEHLRNAIAKLEAKYPGLWLPKDLGVYRLNHVNFNPEVAHKSGGFGHIGLSVRNIQIEQVGQQEERPASPKTRSGRPKFSQDQSSSPVSSVDDRPVSTVDDRSRAIYRFLKPNRGHFFSGSQTELPRSLNYRLEGEAFRVFASSGSGRRALYRCLILNQNRHFLSADPSCEGYHREGAIGFISTAPNSYADRALYRCYKSDRGHLSTVSRSECLNNGYEVENGGRPVGYLP